MTEYDGFREEKSCLVCGGVESEEEWSCERAVYSRSEQRLCGVGLVVRRRRGCLRVVDMLIKEGQWPLMKRRLYLRASVGCACEGERRMCAGGR